MKNVPCKDCTDRKIGCHAECETYKKCIKEYNEAKEKLRNDNRTDSAIWNIKKMR